MAVAIFLSLDASSARSQQYLYSPTALGEDVGVAGKDGVLVQEVVVQKGDTLYGLSRKFSGHGSYYPQILLFNDIKDPDKIYPGNVFKVPVSRNSASGTAAVAGDSAVPAQKPVSPAQAVPAPVSDGSDKELKKGSSGRDKKRDVKTAKVAAPAKKQVSADKQHPVNPVSVDSAAGQKLFERAVQAYRKDDCRIALELFDRFLVEQPSSPLAADASLYKAECYLKLSSQN
jgi:LysM repeat protein